MVDKIIFLIYFILILLYPPQLRVHGITYAKILFVLSFFILIFQLLRDRKYFELKKFKKTSLYYFVLGIFIFSVSVLLSNIISVLLGSKIYLTNVFEIFRGILYIICIINCYIFINKNKNNRSYFEKILLFSIIFTLIICCVQYYNVFNVNSLYVKYIAPTHYKTLISGYKAPRIVGLTGNPNVCGCVLNLYLFYILYKIIKSDKFNLFYILFPLIRIAIYMTGTRSAFIISLFCEVVLFGLIMIKKGNFKPLFRKTILVIICEIALLFSLPNSMTWRIKHLMNLDNINSWSIRVNHNKETIEQIFSDDSSNNIIEEKNNRINEENNIINVEENNNGVTNMDNGKTTSQNGDNKNGANKVIKLLFGVGSNKEIKDAKAGENEWLMILYKYGIFGVLSFLIVFILPFFRIRKYSVKNRALFISICALVAIYMIPQSFYHVYNLMFIYILINCFEMESDLN